MELVPALRRGCDESNPKTASPVPEKVREARSPVILVWSQLRIRKHVNRHEEESVSEPLISSGQGIVCVIRGGSEGAEIPHRSGDSDETDCQQYTDRDDLSLDQLCCNRGE